MRQNCVAQFNQLLKHWLYNSVQLVIVEKNWVLSVDQCLLEVLQFLVLLINSLSILLRCNDFARIQKAIVDQTGNRPTNSDHDILLVQVWGGVLELLLGPATELVIEGCGIKSTFHHMSQSNQEMVHCCCME